jgi:hypothetical protein
MALQRLPLTQEGIAASTFYVDGPRWLEESAIAASTFHVRAPMQRLPTDLTGGLERSGRSISGFAAFTYQPLQLLPPIVAGEMQLPPTISRGGLRSNAASTYHCGTQEKDCSILKFAFLAVF